MRVHFTVMDFRWAGWDLMEAYGAMLDGIERIAYAYESRKDDRTLVILMGCPCCSDANRALSMKNAVFATPFAGIDAPKCVHRAKLRPPCEKPDFYMAQASNKAEFLASFKEAIEEALAAK